MGRAQEIQATRYADSLATTIISNYFFLTACDVEQLPPKVDAVVISHTHYDHLDYNSVKQLNKRYGKKLHWFVPMDMGSWLCDNFGMGKQNVHELTWWQEKELPGSKVK